MDAQAQDRAHRIGQKDTVNIYRFLTSGSCEVREGGLEPVSPRSLTAEVRYD